MNSNNKEFGPEGEDNIGEMLAGLPRVSAPPDFDLHLKARIARGRSIPTRSGFFPALKIAIPASLLAVMAAFLFLSGVVTPDLENVVTVAGNEGVLPPIATTEQAPLSEFVASVDPLPSETIETNPAGIPPISVSADREVAARSASRRNDLRRRATPIIATDANSGGGFLDSTVRRDVPINQNSATAAPPRLTTSDRMAPGFERNSSVPVTDVFELIGIDAVFDGGWQVRSVDSVRSAARSGIKEGDVITAVDGQMVSEKSTLATGTTVRTVTVRRGETSVIVALRN